MSVEGRSSAGGGTVACKNVLTPDENPYTLGGMSKRGARSTDLGSLAALDVVCFGRRAWSRQAWWEVLGSREWRTVVMTHGGAIVAASVLVLTHPVSVLASLAVAPTYRRHGLGKRLLVDAINHAERSRAAWLSLEVDRSNEPARRLYRREGFGILRRFYEDGMGRLELVRRLGGRHGR